MANQKRRLLMELEVSDEGLESLQDWARFSMKEGRARVLSTVIIIDQCPPGETANHSFLADLMGSLPSINEILEMIPPANSRPS